MKHLIIIAIIILLVFPKSYLSAEEVSPSILINKEEYSYKSANPDIEDLEKISSLLVINEDLIKAHLDENQSGIYSLDEFRVEVSVQNNYIVSFESNYPVQFIFVKGGNQGGNLYYYNPSVQSDSNLVTPNNGSNSKPASLSHLVFYYYKAILIVEEPEDPNPNTPNNPEDPNIDEDPDDEEEPKDTDPEEPIIPNEPEDPEEPIIPNEPEDPSVTETPNIPKESDVTDIPKETIVPEAILIELEIPQESITTEGFVEESSISENKEEFLEEDFLIEEIPEGLPMELPNTGGLPQILLSTLGLFSLAIGLIFKINK